MFPEAINRNIIFGGIWVQPKTTTLKFDIGFLTIEQITTDISWSQVEVVDGDHGQFEWSPNMEPEPSVHRPSFVQASVFLLPMFMNFPAAQQCLHWTPRWLFRVARFSQLSEDELPVLIHNRNAPMKELVFGMKELFFGMTGAMWNSPKWIGGLTCVALGCWLPFF